MLVGSKAWFRQAIVTEEFGYGAGQAWAQRAALVKDVLTNQASDGTTATPDRCVWDSNAERLTTLTNTGPGMPWALSSDAVLKLMDHIGPEAVCFTEVVGVCHQIIAANDFVSRALPMTRLPRILSSLHPDELQSPPLQRMLAELARFAGAHVRRELSDAELPSARLDNRSDIEKLQTYDPVHQLTNAPMFTRILLEAAVWEDGMPEGITPHTPAKAKEVNAAITCLDALCVATHPSYVSPRGAILSLEAYVHRSPDLLRHLFRCAIGTVAPSTLTHWLDRLTDDELKCLAVDPFIREALCLFSDNWGRSVTVTGGLLIAYRLTTVK